MTAASDLLKPMEGAEHTEAGGVKIDMTKVGNAG